MKKFTQKMLWPQSVHINCANYSDLISIAVSLGKLFQNIIQHQIPLKYKNS
jgi:hypothetical protein